MDWAQGRQLAPACVAGSEGGGEEQGSRAGNGKRKKKKEEREGGRRSRVPQLVFALYSILPQNFNLLY